MDFTDIKGQIKRPEKTVSLCLRGDLQGEFEDLERELEVARSKPMAATLTGRGNSEAEGIAKKIVAIRVQMQEHSVAFRFRGLSMRAYSDLVAVHPPTDEQTEKNAEADVNWDTFPAALISACSVDPVMNVEQANELADMLTQAQWNAMYAAAAVINQTRQDIPSSYAASAVLASSKRSSK